MHPNRPRQISSRYLNEDATGSAPPVTSVTMGGDVTGDSATSIVTQVQGKPFSSTPSGAGGFILLGNGEITARSNVLDHGILGGVNSISVGTTTIQMGNCAPTWHTVNLQLNAGLGGTFTAATIGTGHLPALNVPQEVSCFFNDAVNFAANGALSLAGRVIANADGSFRVILGLNGATASTTNIRFNLFEIRAI